MKRTQNTTGLKVQFIPCTNTKENRYKITQTNNGKSIHISGNLKNPIIDTIGAVLDKCENVKTYCLLVDNTQNTYYLFSVEFFGDCFENILLNFKNL